MWCPEGGVARNSHVASARLEREELQRDEEVAEARLCDILRTKSVWRVRRGW